MPQVSLPANRAFVVQFSVQPPEAPLPWEGRVEHVVSGQMARFHSMEELLDFLCRVLTDVQKPSAAE